MGLMNNIRKRFADEVDPGMATKVIGGTGTEEYHGYIQQDFNSAFHGDSAIEKYDEMRSTDATVNATLTALKLPIIEAGWSVESPDDTDQDDKITEFVRWNLFDRLKGGFKGFLREGMAHYDFGYYYFEKIYVRENGKLVLDRLAPRHPTAHSQWIQHSTGEMGVTQLLPGNNSVDAENNVTTTSPEIPMWKLVLFVNEMEGSNYDGKSVLRSAYKHWFLKDKLYRIDAITKERGAGILKITLPKSSSEQDKTDAEGLAKNFKLSEHSYLILPNDEWQAELMTPGISDQGGNLANTIQHHDRMIAKNILAQFLNLGDGKAGSFALSKDQSDFFTLSLRAKAEYIEEVINNQLIKQLVDLNFGPQEKYPKFRFAEIGEIDYGEMAGTIEKLVNLGLVNNDPNFKVWIAKTFGLPEATVEDFEEEEIEEPEVEEVDTEEIVEEFAEKRFFRPLTSFEEKVDFNGLVTFFDEREASIRQTVDNFTTEQKSKFMTKVEQILKNVDVAAVNDLSLALTPKLKAELKSESKQAFEEGKRTAANELGQALPSTPGIENKLRDAKVEAMVNARTVKVENAIKGRLLTLLGKGIGVTAGIFSISKLFDKVTNETNAQIAGRVVVDNLNTGRGLVFDRYARSVHGLQRSELLDIKTCPMCMSLDGRVLPKDDPFTKVGQVHTSCRGIWVPILLTEADLPPVKSLPKSILNRFDTVEGVPQVNQFKQQKSPLVLKKSRLERKIKDGDIEI